MPRVLLTDKEISEVIISLTDYINIVRNQHYENDLMRFFEESIKNTQRVLNRFISIQEGNTEEGNGEGNK